jgi:hypothetical protein
MSRAGLEAVWCLSQRFAGCVCVLTSGCGPKVRKPLVVGRVALEGLTSERTAAAAALGRGTRAAGVHRRGARAALCNQPLKLPTALERGALNAAQTQVQWSVNNPSL